MIRENSTHRVEVIPVSLQKHENADSLSVVRAFGYPVVVRTSDWKDGMLGAYLPPDSLVDTERPEFAFLANGKDRWQRIRAKKLRGVQSFGLLVPAPPGSAVGEDVTQKLDVQHWEPPLEQHNMTKGEAESAPTELSHLAKYDIDSLRRYPNVFQPGEKVFVTEKIHGANSRYCFLNGRMWCGSRTEWKRESRENLWWRALKAVPEIEQFCRAHEGWVLYGEVYGAVQSLRYGCDKGEVKFAAFDIWSLEEGEFLDAETFFLETNIPLQPHVVPLLAILEYDFEEVCRLAEGTSHIANHVREGCVVKPARERFHDEIGRVVLKVVGAGYLEK